jgi:hypothetical protein
MRASSVESTGRAGVPRKMSVTQSSRRGGPAVDNGDALIQTPHSIEASRRVQLTPPGFALTGDRHGSVPAGKQTWSHHRLGPEGAPGPLPTCPNTAAITYSERLDGSSTRPPCSTTPSSSVRISDAAKHSACSESSPAMSRRRSWSGVSHTGHRHSPDCADTVGRAQPSRVSLRPWRSR